VTSGDYASRLLGRCVTGRRRPVTARFVSSRDAAYSSFYVSVLWFDGLASFVYLFLNHMEHFFFLFKGRSLAGIQRLGRAGDPWKIMISSGVGWNVKGILHAGNFGTGLTLGGVYIFFPSRWRRLVTTDLGSKRNSYDLLFGIPENGMAISQSHTYLRMYYDRRSLTLQQ
jgi:hypothetical protein